MKDAVECMGQPNGKGLDWRDLMLCLQPSVDWLLGLKGEDGTTLEVRFWVAPLDSRLCHLVTGDRVTRTELGVQPPLLAGALCGSRSGQEFMWSEFGVPQLAINIP